MVNFRRIAVAAAALLPLVSAAPYKRAETIKGKYIVTLKGGASTAEVESHLAWVQNTHKRSLTKRDTAGVEQTYSIGDFAAYAGEFDDATLAEIKNNPEVGGK